MVYAAGGFCGWVEEESCLIHVDTGFVYAHCLGLDDMWEEYSCGAFILRTESRCRTSQLDSQKHNSTVFVLGNDPAFD